MEDNITENEVFRSILAFRYKKIRYLMTMDVTPWNTDYLDVFKIVNGEEHED